MRHKPKKIDPRPNTASTKAFLSQFKKLSPKMERRINGVLHYQRRVNLRGEFDRQEAMKRDLLKRRQEALRQS